MSSIDERVVGMKFNGAQFQQGIATTLGSLDKLKSSLNLTGASKGLENVAAAGKNVEFSHISAAVDNISSKFSAMTVVGVAALATLVSSATTAGMSIAKSLTLKPATDGFSDYELKINATQTIMSGTGEDIQTTTKYLKDLDIYADKTIYNLRDMTSNIGKFTNAGVKLPVATKAMMGVANVAALSGANAEEASRAMYNLGQAIGQGSVKLMDWKSVELANMGTMEFKQQLMDKAVAMGTLKKATNGVLTTTKGTIVTTKNFSTTLADQWLTADALTATLGDYANENTKIGAKAYKAAQDVKSFSMMTETLKASMGTGWTDTFDLLVGDLPEATKMWTNTTNAIGKMINKSSDDRNALIGSWDKWGGRTALITGISLSFKALGAAVKPIKDAFRHIFPATTGKQLYDLTILFRNFAAHLQMGGATAGKVQRVFQGIFAILDIGWMVIKAGIKMFARLFGEATEGSGTFLNKAAKIGDWFKNLRNAIKNGDDLTKFFGHLGDILLLPITLLKKLGGFLSRVFGNTDTSEYDKLQALQDRLAGISDTGDKISSIWSRITGFLKRAAAVFKPVADRFATFFEGLGTTVKEGFSKIDYDQLLATINTALFGGMLILLKKFMKDGLQIGVKADADVGGGLFKTIKTSFGELTNTMKTMQTSLKAETLMKIAIAIGILTISVVALSMIDPIALTKALTAMAAMFTELMYSMQVLEKGSTVKGSAKIAIMAGAMILLAIAVDLLCIAVAKLAKLSWQELAKGLTGLAAILAILVAVTRTMGSNKRMISTGIGLSLMAVGVRILVGAVADLGKLSWEELSKGLVGVGAVLASLALFTRLAAASKGGVAQGAGLILLATGMKILVGVVQDFAAFSWEEIGRGLAGMGGGLAIMAAALLLIPPSSILSAVAILIVASSLKLIGDAVKSMGEMSWETIGKGMAVLAGALILIAGALALLPPSSLLSAAAIFIVASSLKLIAEALGTMGGMTWGEIAKGLVTLASALTIIAITVTAMILALPGAMALMIVAGALAILAPILLAFGKMSWEEIAKGLAMLAGVFLVIGVAGALLMPVIPAILALGFAIGLIGVAMLAAGLGILAFATAFTIFAAVGTVGFAVIAAGLTLLISLIPGFMTQLGLGLIAFATVITTAGPAILGALTTILLALIGALVAVIPALLVALGTLLTAFLKFFVDNIPKLVNAGMKLIQGLLTGISNNIRKIAATCVKILTNLIKGITDGLPDLIKAGKDLIVAFIKGIGSSATDIINAAADTLITFLNGLATTIRTKGPELNKAGGNIASAIVEGMVKGITDGLHNVVEAAQGLAKGALGAVKNFLGIHSPSVEFQKLGDYVTKGFALGIIGGLDHVQSALEKMRTMVKSTMDKTQADVTKAKAKLVTLDKAKGTTATAITKAQISLDQAKHAKKPDKGRIKKAELTLKSALTRKRNILNDIKTTQMTLGIAQLEHKKSVNAQKSLNTLITRHQKELTKLGTDYDTQDKQLKEAKDILEGKQKEMFDSAKSITSQYSTLPDIDKKTKLSSYKDKILKETELTAKFKATLDQLRALGMDDTTYNKLLSEGIEAQPFLDQLLKSGKTGIAELNVLDKNLADTAGGLGKKASTDLYQVGVNVAQGVVNGLNDSMELITDRMTVIATSMVAAIKKQLKIKSPSRVFAEIGKYSNEGLANGLDKYSSVVEKSAAGVGHEAINAMKKSISGISGIVSGDMDMRPRISPILDLSHVKKNAGLIDGMLKPPPFALGESYASASSVAAARRAHKETFAMEADKVSAGLKEKIEFVQYNYSPKALSSIEIYRQTKNQISAAKGALK